MWLVSAVLSPQAPLNLQLISEQKYECTSQATVQQSTSREYE